MVLAATESSLQLAVRHAPKSHHFVSAAADQSGAIGRELQIAHRTLMRFDQTFQGKGAERPVVLRAASADDECGTRWRQRDRCHARRLGPLLQQPTTIGGQDSNGFAVPNGQLRMIAAEVNLTPSHHGAGHHGAGRCSCFGSRDFDSGRLDHIGYLALGQLPDMDASLDIE